MILILSFNFLSRFGFQISLAEQDFFTNLGFIHPELFHILPCTFNKQESIQVSRRRGGENLNFFIAKELLSTPTLEVIFDL